MLHCVTSYLVPHSFQSFINDLVYSIKQKGCGIRLDDDYISILMFADDVSSAVG